VCNAHLYFHINILVKKMRIIVKFYGTAWMSTVWTKVFGDVGRLYISITNGFDIVSLMLFGHIARMDDNADAKRILLASPVADCMRQLHHVAQQCPTGSETSQFCVPQSSGYGSEPLSVEDDVDIWHCAILSCMQEMTMVFIVYDELSSSSRLQHFWHLKLLIELHLLP